MQNKNAVLLFTVLLSLATPPLSFNWVANNYEDEAANWSLRSGLAQPEKSPKMNGKTQAQATREFLRRANAEIYPMLGHTYREVIEQELNLGLDLQGGMSVTLEVASRTSSSP